MDFSLSPDQVAVLSAIDALAKPFAAVPIQCRDFALYSAELDQALENGGFLDVASVPELGAVTAALIVERVAALPYCTEIAASALIRPFVCPELPRPLCLVNGDRPARFLKQAATALCVDGETVRALSVEETAVAPVDSLFGYPMARFANGSAIYRDAPIWQYSAEDLRHRWRVALAAEVAGLLKAAIDCTIDHVTNRQQFGRPLGSFQGVRHRLAEAYVRTGGVRLLALRAAESENPTDSALAAFYAQDAAATIIYDLHQFSGAMGITLEHPLHLWTYRLKALLSEMGGRIMHVDAASASLGR